MPKKDPIDELRHLRIGDFIELGEALTSQFSLDNIPPIALVTGKGNPGDEINQDYDTGHPEIILFERGYPIKISVGTGFKGFITRKVSSDEAKTYFDILLQQSNLNTAIRLSRGHDLQVKISRLEEAVSDAHTILTAPPESCGTGVYVVRGIYTPAHLSRRTYKELRGDKNAEQVRHVAYIGNNLQAITLPFPISVQELEGRLISSYKTGIGLIPKSFTRLEHGKREKKHLVDYEIFEVPKEALYLINKPMEIELK